MTPNQPNRAEGLPFNHTPHNQAIIRRLIYPCSKHRNAIHLFAQLGLCTRAMPHAGQESCGYLRVFVTPREKSAAPSQLSHEQHVSRLRAFVRDISPRTPRRPNDAPTQTSTALYYGLCRRQVATCSTRPLHKPAERYCPTPA